MAEGNKPSGDFMSSGKVVAGAAVSAFQQKSVENVDKKEVAGAAAGILHSASTYGKLEDKPVGQYMEKAEGYLKGFSAGGPAAEKEKADAPAGDAPKPVPQEAPAPAADEGKSSEGFGVGDVMKGAESLMEKQGGGEESGGAGGLFKMAKGFMK